MINIWVCSKIRKIRIQRHYSQEYLAFKLGISQSYYAKIENGKKEISINMFFSILTLLETDFISFFDDFDIQKLTG